MEYLRFEKRDRVGVLTLDRPAALNALNRAVLEELDRFLEGAAQREGIRALVVTGAGEKAFVAGADIKEMQALDSAGMRAFCGLGQKVMGRLEGLEAVTVAAVNGYALGGGLELALACDWIYASSTARLGLPEVTLGLIPGFGGTQRLARAVGARRAKELVLGGQAISASEAFAIGLVNRVVAPDRLLAACEEAAQQVCRNAFGAAMLARRAIDRGVDLPLAEGLALERDAFGRACDLADRAEGLAAFLEKRPAEFG